MADWNQVLKNASRGHFDSKTMIALAQMRWGVAQGQAKKGRGEAKKADQ